MVMITDVYVSTKIIQCIKYKTFVGFEEGSYFKECDVRRQSTMQTIVIYICCEPFNYVNKYIL